MTKTWESYAQASQLAQLQSSPQGYHTMSANDEAEMLKQLGTLPEDIFGTLAEIGYEE